MSDVRNRRDARWCVAILATVGTFWLLESPAFACTKIAPERTPFMINEGLQATDTEAPVPFSNVQARVARGKGQVCDDNGCTSNGCGDTGSIFFSFQRPGAPANEAVGYYFEPLAGIPPAELPTSRATALTLPAHGLDFDIPFDEVPRIDATVALVAIDQAGNESAPSNPVDLMWSGCTHAPTGDKCLEEDNGACSMHPSPEPFRPMSLVVGLLTLSWTVLRRGRSWRSVS